MVSEKSRPVTFRPSAFAKNLSKNFPLPKPISSIGPSHRWGGEVALPSF